MDKMARINGKMVELPDEERIAAEKFHRSRLSFAWINGDLVVNDNMSDDRDHHHWMGEDYGVTDEDFEKLPRGYMMLDKIQLFVGSSFAQISKADLSIPMRDILKLRDLYRKTFPENSGKVWIYNGVTIGKVGEIWSPIECLGELYVD